MAVDNQKLISAGLPGIVGREEGEIGEVCSRILYKREREIRFDSKDARATIVVYTHLLRKLGRELGGMPFNQM